MRLTRFRAARGSVRSDRGRTWPWAVGSIVVVVLVLGATLLGHTIVSGRHRSPVTVSPPPLPPLDVVGATPAGTSAQLVALDANAGHLVALTAPGEPVCPPNAACPPAPPLQSLTVLDGQTGAILAATPLTPSGTRSVLLLADPSRHLAYAVAPQSVDIYSTVTGKRTGGYVLPSVPWTRESGGILDPVHGELILVGGTSIEAFDAATGHPLAVWQLPADTTRTEGPVLDVAHGLLYLLTQSATSQPLLLALDTATLARTGQMALPGGARLGPLDAATQTLYIFGKSGTPCQFSVSVAGGLALTPTASAGSVCDAGAVGWNPALGHVYLAAPAGILIRDAATHQSVAALPVRVAWPATAPLLVDPSRGLLYLPDQRGMILIVRDGAVPVALSAGSALLLARAALARFLPDTNQDPPFVAPESFPAADGATSLSFWIHFADIGWRGPYAGTTATAVSAAPGRPGNYQVTFTLSWYQVFQRHHVWVCLVAPDGGVLLQSESGDTVP
ncbi:MAG TPA: hypothetical protein VKQ30_24130 [Ktedonobacterales bacterium]|nr:hypothetical protein [Ktedonobacterales bacterium]